ncbi:MAG: D-alanyl-D-alanine carboxypeptidase/D-alanyl-D-alanine-endopeptidase [Cyanobacteria bacterium SIG28]|nr:D-alanyl-D-alanine carboxypeptidase/D-alanyl-D-alanine-endopeptidase [Cyanobacteria bacterium SIG28]
MKKVLLLLLILFLFPLFVDAKKAQNNFIDIIKEFDADVESIAISIKNLDTGKVVYSLNDKMLMTPASVQKILTTPVAAEVLGEDYNFETGLFQRNNDEVLIKLGADPYLTTKNLKELIKKDITSQTKTIYIDDTAIDNKIWGEGWQWDDDLNTLMPRFNSYNLDKNLIKLTIMPSEKNQIPTIINPTKFPLVFFNNLATGKQTDIKVQRDTAISPNTLVLSGTVARPTTIYIPNINLKQYFENQLTKILHEKSIYIANPYRKSIVNDNDVLKNSVSHDIEKAITDVLKNSNNLTSESMFKLAGAKYSGQATGTDIDGIKMFNEYCVKNKLDNSRIRITDASGVSKNNLVSTDFVSEFLVKSKNNYAMQYLATPGEGTLTHRMLQIKNNLRAKTGTLSDVSSIAGYLTSKSGKNYAFCIITNDIKLSESDKKMLEDYIIREAYLRL